MDKLTGHATKNQDLLVASGAVSLRGPESAQALEEDVQAVRAPSSASAHPRVFLPLAPNAPPRPQKPVHLSWPCVSTAASKAAVAFLLLARTPTLQRVRVSKLHHPALRLQNTLCLAAPPASLR